MPRRRAFWVVLAIIPLVLVTGPRAEDYGWTISSSQTDPFQNSGPVVPGLLTLYLWFSCAPAGADHAVGAEFRMTWTNATFLSLTFTNPFIIGITQTIDGGDIFAVPINPATPPVTAASLLLLATSTSGVEVCFGPHSETGLNATVVADCEAMTTTLHPNTFIGWSSSDIAGSCVSGLCDDATPVDGPELTTWGRLKSIYRGADEVPR